MEIKAICDMYKSNLLQSALIAPAKTPGEWVLLIKTTDGREFPVTFIRSNEQKTYKSVQGACGDVQKIGFPEAGIRFPEAAVKKVA